MECMSLYNMVSK